MPSSTAYRRAKRLKKFYKRTARVTKNVNTVHKFVRTYIIDKDVLNRLFVEGGISGRLDALPDYTDFTNLFDSYRITGMSATFQYDKTSADVGSALSVSNLGTCTDKDDITALSSEAPFWQYQDFKYRPLTRQVKVYTKPKIAVAVYGGGVFTDFASASKTWIDCNSPDVEHYGIRYFIHDPTGTALGDTVIGKLKIVVKLWIECKYVR